MIAFFIAGGTVILIINPVTQVDRVSTFSKYCEMQSVTHTLFLQIVDDNSVLGKCRKVVCVEEFFEACNYLFCWLQKDI